VKTFRALGCSVAVTSAVGAGFPDLVVGINGLNIMVEIKDGAKPPSERRLTPAQVDFHGYWRGQIVVIETVDQVIALVAAVRGHLSVSRAFPSGTISVA